MKKIVAICLAVLMMVSLSVTCFAEGFVSSPSNNKAPTIVESENSDENSDSELIIISYGDRDKLNSKKKQKFEKAYEQISKSDDLTDLVPELEDYAKDKGVDPEDLAVSDLFYADETNSQGNGKYKVSLKADTLNNFVALKQFDGEKWVIIKDAKVNSDGTLTFTLTNTGPLAIVVDGSKSPVTGDATLLTLTTVLIVSVIALGAVLIALKKKRA